MTGDRGKMAASKFGVFVVVLAFMVIKTFLDTGPKIGVAGHF